MKKKLIIIIPLLIAVITFVFVYRYYNKEDATTTLTVKEKKWVTENKDERYDFEIINDYPLYGHDGTGVFFDFIDDFEQNVGVEFNKISYLKNSTPTENSFRIRILDNEAKLSDKDLPLFIDNYIVIGKTYKRIKIIAFLSLTQFFCTLTKSSRYTFFCTIFSNSFLAFMPIFFNIDPCLPIRIPF